MYILFYRGPDHKRIIQEHKNA